MDTDKTKHDLIQDMVFSAVAVGFTVVQELAAETLKRKPGTNLKEFTKILDEYLEKQHSMRKTQ